jgi:cell fate regulator YaaT (PSP1 superfamily)
MARYHLVRVGTLGHIGRFAAVDQTRFPRGSRVVVRTPRGLEVGEVLAPPADFEQESLEDGELLRGMTVEDELLDARLQKNRLAAYEACQARLDAVGVTTPLVEVEQLFDGRTLVFYFLGPPSTELDAITQELAEAYDSQAQIAKFATTLTEGCGPDCGTEHATGHGCTSCASGCAIADACGKKG